MLKAGSLLYAIFISLIIGSIATSFVLYSYYQKLRMAQYEGRIEAIERVHSAMNLLRTQEIKDFDPDKTYLFSRDEQAIQLQLEHWGGFYLATAKTSFRQSSFQESVLLGYKNETPFALYLADNNHPLSLCGDARVIGNSFIPQRGLKRAYIEGKSYSGKDLINGTKTTSENKIPDLNDPLKDYLDRILLDGIPKEAHKVVSYNDVASEGVLESQQSFQDSTLCYYSPERIYLYDGKLKGRIIVKSEESIYLEGTVFAEDILLIAPRIELAANFKGSIHLIASDTIIIGAYSELYYPSSILLESKRERSAIIIQESAKIAGEVILYGTDNYTNKGVVSIKEAAELTGNVYSFDKVELRGKVKGSITCEKFILKTSSSIYENHLLDGVINAEEMPQEYLGIQIKTSQRIRGIAKWLD
ncbi:MAG: polymer-forming cytoskeletal protein [Flavobacteriales bacterium]|nr:polymer-forming cytoskeletal protein [Flavobacteriales bacterium]